LIALVADVTSSEYVRVSGTRRLRGGKRPVVGAEHLVVTIAEDERIHRLLQARERLLRVPVPADEIDGRLRVDVAVS
jgi:hypothetical protein